MALPKKKYPTVANIRTYSKKVSAQLPKHKAYLMLSYLEMKRTRLDQEKQMLLKRLEAIEKQSIEIDKDKEFLLQQHPQETFIQEKTPFFQDNQTHYQDKFTIKY